MQPDELLSQLAAAMEEANSALRKAESLASKTFSLLAEEEAEADTDQLAELAYAAHLLKGYGADVFRIVEENVSQAFAGRVQEVTLPNGAIVERKAGYNRKAWDHQGLAAIVARRIKDSAIDMDTGEILMDDEEMIRAMIKYAAPSYWRVGKLKELGINPDEYCTVEEDPQVRLVVRKAPMS